MRIGRWCGAVDSIAAGAGAHEHHTHAIGMPAIDGLEIAMVECILPEYSDDALDNVFVRNRAVFLDAFGGVLLIFAAESHDDVRYRLAEILILGFVALLQSRRFC